MCQSAAVNFIRATKTNDQNSPSAVVSKSTNNLFKIICFLKSTNAPSTPKNFMFAHGPVMYEDPKSAKILVLGDLVPEIMPKNRFWAIFGPFFGFFQNPVKSEWL